MQINHLPKVSFAAPETNCCPRFDPRPWDEQQFLFRDKLFVKSITLDMFHIPVLMGRMMRRTWKKITDAHADSADEFVLLSYDPSLWKSEHLFSVEKPVPGLEMVYLSGTFLTKVFEGPYEQIEQWMEQMNQYVEARNQKIKKLYLYYTTCPRCAKYYGKNYVVAFAQIV